MNKRKGSMNKILLILQVLLISNLFLPTIAYAYVDPGSGSVIVTTILGLIAAISYTFRKYFYKIKRLITGKILKKDKGSQEQSDKSIGN